jgi:hypothetical protein
MLGFVTSSYRFGGADFSHEKLLSKFHILEKYTKILNAAPIMRMQLIYGYLVTYIK